MLTYRAFSAGTTAEPFPPPTNPRKALRDPLIARYFHHYIADIAPWYDLSDAASSFGTKVPEMALENPLPFAAILALSAAHMSRTTAPSARAAAEFYHAHCVRLLIRLAAEEEEDEADNGADTRDVALASVCLLRSYEILSEEVDPNRHLQGAYSLAAYRNPAVDCVRPGLRAAGFWNYLREDITFSLFQRCPLKIDLDQIPLPKQHGADGDCLNTVALILGRIVNNFFAGFAIKQKSWAILFNLLRTWVSSLPNRFRPFSRIERGLNLTFPSIWMLQDSHGAALHYQLVCMAILCIYGSAEQIAECRGLADLGVMDGSREDMLEKFAQDICGGAFTANAPAVLVNAFGPIAFCARFIRAEASRQELIRRLMACKRTTGWPVQRLVSELQVEWRGTPTHPPADATNGE